MALSGMEALGDACNSYLDDAIDAAEFMRRLVRVVNENELHVEVAEALISMPDMPERVRLGRTS